MVSKFAGQMVNYFMEDAGCVQKDIQDKKMGSENLKTFLETRWQTNGSLMVHTMLQNKMTSIITHTFNCTQLFLLFLLVPLLLINYS